MFSATQHPESISEYLKKELELGLMLGPFVDRSGFKSIHIRRFGIIPKGNNTGKWRLITHLSYPPGYSMNDEIDPNICSLFYTTVKDVASVCALLGPNATIAKVDIRSAYRLVPVHPDDRPLLGMKWNDQFYIDPMLPFGLRSDPKSTCRRPRMVVERGRVRNDFHYLDIPLAAHKCEGPSICVTFLGIVIDTATGELRLPPEKLVHLRSLLSEWGDRKACGRRELESLIGYLNHACKVIRPGRSFLRRIIDLLHRNPNTYHPIRLNCQFRLDLQWWKSFAAGWNGTSYITTPSAAGDVVPGTGPRGSSRDGGLSQDNNP